MTTTNLGDFGYRELDLAADLLKAWANGNLPNEFEQNGVQIMMNQNSGDVFLTNSKYQVCMKCGDDIEMFYITPYSGHEGFGDELKEQYEQDGDSWNQEDINYITSLGIIEADGKTVL